MKTTELDGRSINNPVFCAHKRGRNWAAIVTGKNAANCERRFLRTSGRIVDLAAVSSGDVVEIGGDYVTASGRRHPDREFWLIHEIDDDHLTYELHESLAKAIRAARQKSGQACVGGTA